MKTKWIVSVPAFLILLLVILSFDKEDDPGKYPATGMDTLHYNDGFYSAASKGKYTSENFWGHIGITVEGSLITDVSFVIRDSSLHENVDSMYGVRHYQGTPEYQKQCVNDGNGIKIYPQRLMQFQNIDDVDGISGATWSHNIFDSTTRKAFRNGVIETGWVEKRLENSAATIIARPNPFDSSVVLEYRLAGKRYVTLGIYNSSGRLVKQLVDATQTEGNYTVEWNDCPSFGIYYCRLQLDDQTICNKIIQVQ
jgi:major membrane immunogen (membrane-anchored lipoprotein)